MKLWIIGNPVAGGGKAQRLIDELAGLLRQRGHEVEVRLTQKPGDAPRFAAEAPPDIDRLIVAGGDGTLHEVVNGLADPSRFPIVQMPAGTANVLVRELGLPWKPADVAELIESGRERRIDMGVARLGGDAGGNGGGAPVERRFVVVTSSGFDAMVIQDIAAHRDGKLGARGYIKPILRTFCRYKPTRLRVTLDDGESHDAALAIVSNTRNYGGLLTVADQASMDSGHFDVCLLPRSSLPALLRYAFWARLKKLSTLRDVTYRQSQRVRIEADAPVPVEADGEFLGHTPVEVTIRPGALRIIAPAQGGTPCRRPASGGRLGERRGDDGSAADHALRGIRACFPRVECQPCRSSGPTTSSSTTTSARSSRACSGPCGTSSSASIAWSRRSGA